VKATLVKAILALFETDEGLAAMDAAYQWDGMVEKGDDFYEPFRQMLDASGVNIEDLSGE
jgi:ABC-type phosphate/phosphonate transport system substrate-binding protein